MWMHSKFWQWVLSVGGVGLVTTSAVAARLDGAEYIATTITPQLFDQEIKVAGQGPAQAQSPGVNTGFGTPGATAFADETNTTRTWAGSGQEPGTYSAEVRWTGFYTKTEFGLESFRYTVNPAKLELIDFGSQNPGGFSARWEIRVLIDGVLRSSTRVEIAGRRGTTANETFELVEERGVGLATGEYEEVVDAFGNVNVARYTTGTASVSLALDYDIDDQFIIDYYMIAEVQGIGGETYAVAQVGDPFGTSGGVVGEVVAVPEPGAITLFGGAGLTFVWPRRQTRRRA